MNANRAELCILHITVKILYNIFLEVKVLFLYNLYIYRKIIKSTNRHSQNFQHKLFRFFHHSLRYKPILIAQIGQKTF